MSRKIQSIGSEWNAIFRLGFIAIAGALWVSSWVILNGGGSALERAWGALTAAFVPLAIAWPRLFRHVKVRANTPTDEVDRLRRAGAI